jgi:hypothetical protein
VVVVVEAAVVAAMMVIRAATIRVAKATGKAISAAVKALPRAVARAAAKVAVLAAVAHQKPLLPIALRQHLASRAAAAMLVTTRRADLNRCLAPKHRANRPRVSTHLANIRASRPRLPLRSHVSRTLRHRPRAVIAAATSSRCGVRPRRAAAVRGVARARVATSNRVYFD